MSEAEFIALNFHKIYEALAPEYGYKTRVASAVIWDDLPSENKRLMIATVKELLNHGVIKKGANYYIYNPSDTTSSESGQEGE